MQRITRKRLRTELRDLVELVLAPGLAAVLPWRWCFALFRRLATLPWLYRAGCAQALAQAQALGQVAPGQETAWLATRRLVTLVDHADHWLALTRSDAFMRRHLRLQGQWPAPDEAAVCLTFHWGAGMWALRHAGQAGLQAHALVAAMQGTPFAGRGVLRRYALARTASVGRALGHAPLVVSASLRPVVRALRQRQQVFAAVDVPADQVDASLIVTLCGRQARVPKGLLRLAVDMQVPVAVYLTGFDLATGRRELQIVRLGPHADVQSLADAVFAHLQSALARNGAFWHFWAEAPRFFVPELKRETHPPGG
ncbi:hypothetical protein [Comamonas sp. NLF-1-9]|uniref:hypothetical protein n=1 Tax=Comamonas sp. NLF-1-9 TaxID=2853163 RepID=UPI001C489808|nr:hypothetical protein [Comamonas sp. NLF-1-9]QXL83548.1 hypothetical protein KUD94_09790 [Comamonas sp. NLF-1-9]